MKFDGRNGKPIVRIKGPTLVNPLRKVVKVLEIGNASTCVKVRLQPTRAVYAAMAQAS